VFEKMHQVGQGTYGSVFVGKDKGTGDIVALKRINTEQEENGFPITAIREVKILKALNHSNVVNLLEIVTSKGAFPLRICLSLFFVVLFLPLRWRLKFRESLLFLRPHEMTRSSSRPDYEQGHYHGSQVISHACSV